MNFTPSDACSYSQGIGLGEGAMNLRSHHHVLVPPKEVVVRLSGERRNVCVEESAVALLQLKTATGSAVQYPFSF